MMNRNTVDTQPKRKTQENQSKENKSDSTEQKSDIETGKPTDTKKGINVYKWLPERIRELRKKLTLSQAKFATLLKVSTGTIANWEQGYTTPTEISRRRLNRIRAKLQ